MRPSDLAEPAWLTDAVLQQGHPLTPEIPLYLHVVRGTEAVAAIDAGLPGSAGTVDALVAAATDEGRLPLRYACNTHAHHDHIGNLGRLQAERGALVVCAEGARSWLEDPEVNMAEFAFHHPAILGPTPELRAELEPTFAGGVAPDVLVGDTLVLSLGGGVELESFRVDGHVTAELAWFERSTRCLILGDAVTAIDWPFFHGHLRPAAFRRTLATLRAFVAEREVAVVAMSHYAPRAASDFLDLLDEVEAYLDRVYAAVDAQFPDDESPIGLEAAWFGVCAALGKEPEFRSLGMVAAHIDELVAAGSLRETADDTYIRTGPRPTEHAKDAR